MSSWSVSSRSFIVHPLFLRPGFSYMAPTRYDFTIRGVMKSSSSLLLELTAFCLKR